MGTARLDHLADRLGMDETALRRFIADHPAPSPEAVATAADVELPPRLRRDVVAAIEHVARDRPFPTDAELRSLTTDLAPASTAAIAEEIGVSTALMLSLLEWSSLEQDDRGEWRPPGDTATDE